MKLIKYPTQKRLKELFDYREDGELIRKIKPTNSVKIGDVAGSINGKGYRLICVDSQSYKSHRLVWIWNYGFNPENDIDHINRIKSDNRIKNLRSVSISCNMRNKGNSVTNTSGVKGVSLYKRYKKWEVGIWVSGKLKHIGLHDDFNEAVLHRLAAEQCLNWSNCDSSSPAYQYCIKNNLIKKETDETLAEIPK